jgi:hypothetical protein
MQDLSEKNRTGMLAMCLNHALKALSRSSPFFVLINRKLLD